MAIQVSGTQVIGNSRELTNIASVDATTAASITAAGVGGGVAPWVWYRGRSNGSSASHNIWWAFGGDGSTILNMSSYDWGICVSTDNGYTFSSPNTNLSSQTQAAYGLYGDPTASQTFLSASDNNGNTSSSGIWRTTNAGSSWSRVYSGMGTVMAMSPSGGRWIWSSYNSSGTLYFARSTDGVNWSTSSLSNTENVYAIDVTDSGVVCAAIKKEIWRSTDGGNTFTEVADIGTTGNFRSMKTDNDGTWMAYHNYEGLYKSTDDGATWSPQVHYGEVDKLYYGGGVWLSHSGGLGNYSVDGGNTWLGIASGVQNIWETEYPAWNPNNGQWWSARRNDRSVTLMGAITND